MLNFSLPAGAAIGEWRRIRDDGLDHRTHCLERCGCVTIHDLDGVGPLKTALEDESPDVRQAVFVAMAKINRAWDIDE